MVYPVHVLIWYASTVDSGPRTGPPNPLKSATSDNNNTLTGVTESLAGVTLNTNSNHWQE